MVVDINAHSGQRLQGLKVKWQSMKAHALNRLLNLCELSAFLFKLFGAIWLGISGIVITDTNYPKTIVLHLSFTE